MMFPSGELMSNTVALPWERVVESPSNICSITAYWLERKHAGLCRDKRLCCLADGPLSTDTSW